MVLFIVVVIHVLQKILKLCYISSTGFGIKIYIPMISGGSTGVALSYHTDVRHRAFYIGCVLPPAFQIAHLPCPQYLIQSNFIQISNKPSFFRMRKQQGFLFHTGYSHIAFRGGSVLSAQVVDIPSRKLEITPLGTQLHYVVQSDTGIYFHLMFEQDTTDWGVVKKVYTC